MLLPASQDYIALCQSQVSLLLQGIGAQEIAVYMTDQLEATEDVSLTPLVVYPELPNESPAWQLQLPQAKSATEASPVVMEPALTDRSPLNQEPTLLTPWMQNKQFPQGNNATQANRQQIVLPLMHDSAMLGVLMVARFGPPWTSRDQSQVEQVATTLAMACVLDQRSQWLSQSGFEKKALLSEEHHRLSNLLHQFRNPLTALKTLGKLMLRRMETQDPNRDFAQTIVEQSDRLELLLREFSQTLDVGEETLDTLTPPWSIRVDDDPSLPLLPAAGVISGATLTIQPCWLAEVLSSVLFAAVGRLEERNLELIQSIPDDLPPIQGDAEALTEIFSNLLDNAIKYTPDGGLISIGLIQASSDDDRGQTFQVVSVSDTGLGIPQADLTRIFEGRYRGIQAESKIQGTGLGLAIARDLIHKMNGTIEAFSPALDQHDAGHPGSTFKVKLPQVSPGLHP